MSTSERNNGVYIISYYYGTSNRHLRTALFKDGRWLDDGPVAHHLIDPDEVLSKFPTLRELVQILEDHDRIQAGDLVCVKAESARVLAQEAYAGLFEEGDPDNPGLPETERLVPAIREVQSKLSAPLRAVLGEALGEPNETND